MDNVREKLTQCFSLAFPKIDPGRFPEARVENLSEWDSLAHVRLLTLIGEEFAVDVDREKFESATSFQELAGHLVEEGPAA